MGRELVKAVLTHQECRLIGAIVRPGDPYIGEDAGSLIDMKECDVILSDDKTSAIKRCNVVIDFTSPNNSLETLERAVTLNTPILIGTTGFTEAEISQIESAAKRIPVLYSPNTSVGVNIFWHAAEMIATKCDSSYSISIDESHHVHKMDSPSGTAKRLQEIVASASQRGKLEVPVKATREGEIIGKHTVTFASSGDTISLTHDAKDRGIFARGAVEAALWLAKQKPGYYGMNDYLGFSNNNS